MPGVRGAYAKQLSEWQIDTPSDEVVCYAEFLGMWSAQEGPSSDRSWLPEDAKYTGEVPASDFKVIADSSLGRRPGTVPAVAYIESISGRKARCLVQVAGSELPVELPVRILEARSLGVGMRFLWWMSEDGSVTAHDIDDVPPNRLSALEEEEGQRLYQELCDDIAAGDDWGVNP